MPTTPKAKRNSKSKTKTKTKTTKTKRKHRKTVEWYTPEKIIQALGGKFQLDPAAPEKEWRTATECYTRADDGLSRDWGDKLVFLNPPYTGIEPWMAKLAKHHNGIGLVFVRSDAQWMQVHALAADLMLLVEGRIKFDLGKSGRAKAKRKTASAPAPSVLLAYGAEASARLARAFLQGTIKGRLCRDLEPGEVFADYLGKQSDPQIFKAWPALDPNVQDWDADKYPEWTA